MISNRQLFLNNLAQTSPSPLMLEILQADGYTLTDVNGKKYIDFISGVSVSNIGHRHPHVIEAIEEQIKHYLHLMVYGEYVLSPQTSLARGLTHILPPSLNSCYFVNSGTEATEGAMKLAKRCTGRGKFLAFANSYHGHTIGAMSLMDNTEFTKGYGPFLPGVDFIAFNDKDQLTKIDNTYAAIIIELVKAESGCIPAEKKFIADLVARCRQHGVMIVLDEIQTGFGRTGSMFAFEDYNFVPDILTLGKGMAGGMPMGAFIASHEKMKCLSHHPVLGHLTTFGGHPVSCAAALANLNYLITDLRSFEIVAKEELVRTLLVHPSIRKVHGKGLLLAVEFENIELNQKIISLCIDSGIITDWFLFAPQCMRIAPPLNCPKEIIEYTCNKIIEICNSF